MQNANDLDNVLNTGLNSDGSAEKEQEKYMQSISAKINAFQESVKNLFSDSISTDFIKGVIDAGTELVNLLDKCVNGFGGFATALGLAGAGAVIFNKDMNNMVTGLSSGIPLYGQIVKKIDDYKVSLGKQIEDKKEEIKVSKEAGESYRGLSKELGLLKVKQAAAAIGATALNAALTMGIGVIVGAGINWLIEKYDELAHAYENNIELMEESRNNIKSNNDEIKNLSNLSAEYDKLTNKTKLTTEEQEKLKSVKEQLAQNQNLIAGYDNEGKAIIANSQAVKDEIELLKEKNKLENEKIVATAIKNAPDTKKEKDGLLYDEKNYEKKIQKEKDSKKYFENELKKIGTARTPSEINNKSFYMQNIETSDKSIADYNEKLADTKIKIHDMEMENSKLLPSIYSTNDAYGKLSDSAKAMVDNVVRSDKNFKDLGFPELQKQVEDVIKTLDGVNVDKLQIDLKKALSKSGGNVDSAEYKKAADEILSHIPKLKNQSQEVKDALIKGLSVSENEVDTSGEDKTIAALNKVKEAGNPEEIGKFFNETKKSLQELNDIKYQMDSGQFDNQALSSAIEQYPQLIGLMGDEAAMREWITNQIYAQEEAQRQAYIAMIENDEKYYENTQVNNESIQLFIQETFNSILVAHSEMTEKKADDMRKDLENSKTLAQAKGVVETNLIKSLLNEWSKYYNATNGTIDFDAASKDGLKAGSRDDYIYLRDKAKSIKNVNQNAIDEIDKAIASIKAPEFKKINMGSFEKKDIDKKSKDAKKEADKKAKDAEKQAKKVQEVFDENSYDNQLKKMNLEMEKYNRLLEQSAKATKTQLDYLQKKYDLIKKQVALTQEEIKYQYQLSRTAIGTPKGNTTSASSNINSVIQNAVDNYVGKVKYEYGGKSLATGIDCSGFVVELYKQMGISISGDSATLSTKGAKVDKNSLQRGDLVFFKGSKPKANGIGHVGMYIGDGKFIEAANKNAGIRVSNLSSRKDYVTSRRIADFGGGSSGVTGGTSKKFTVTYYTDLPSENGGYTTNAYGQKLTKGMVASNVYAKGTQIYLDGIGTVTVADKGGSSFNKDNRLDIFVPRNSGENDDQYLRRVNNMGKKTVNGTIGGNSSSGSSSDSSNDTITAQDRQQALDRALSLEGQLLDYEKQLQDLYLEIQKNKLLYKDEGAIGKLESLTKRSELFANNMSSGSKEAVSYLTTATDRYETLAKHQENIKNSLYKMAQDKNLTEAQRIELWNEYYAADLKWWEDKNAQQEAYLNTVKAQLYAAGEVEYAYKEGVKKRNLTLTSYYMENTPENAHAVKAALAEQRDLVRTREEEKNKAYKLYTTDNKLTPKQREELKQEYMNRDNAFYEARNELDELLRRQYEIDLNIKLKPNEESLKKLKSKLERLENYDSDNYGKKFDINKDIYDEEQSKYRKFQKEILESEYKKAALEKENADMVDKTSEKFQTNKEEIKALNDHIITTNDKLMEQGDILSQTANTLMESLRNQLDNESQFNIFGVKKEDYEEAMNDRLDGYQKQIKAITEEEKYLTENEKKWQLELLKDDLKKSKLTNFDDEIKALENIDKLEQDRIDKLKYQVDIEKAKQKLENVKNGR